MAAAVDANNNVYTVDYEQNLGSEMSITKRDANGNLLWVTSYNQTDNTKWERAQWIETDNNGNVIVCGTYMSGYSNPVVASSILMKFNSSGTLKWRKVYESDFDGSQTTRCLVDASNSIYVLGMGSGPNGYVTKVKKFAPNGTVIWTYYDPDGIGAPLNFKFTPDNHILIIARGVVGSVNGYQKIDLNGNKIWSLVGVFSLGAGDCAGDAFGNTYVAHNEYVFNGTLEVKKLDPSGAILWDSVYGEIYGRTFVEVGTDNLPVVYGSAVAGTGSSFTKLDESGNQLWLNTNADEGQNLLLWARMLMDENNNAYIAAGTLFNMAVCRVNSDGSTGWTALTTSGGYANSMVFGEGINSIFVVGGITARIDYEGAPAECNTPTNIGFGGITQLTITVHWDAVPGAVQYEIWRKKSSATSWKIQFVPADKTSKKFKNLTCGTSFDFKIRTICDEAGTIVSDFSDVYQQSTNPCRLENENVMVKSMQVYPNPVSDVMTIELNLPDDFINGTMQLVDMNGRVMISQKLNEDTETLSLDVSRISSGVYLLRIVNQQHLFTQRVMIE